MANEQAAVDPHYRPPGRSAKAWAWLRWNLYLLSLRLFYRITMRVAHRFNWHHMKPLPIWEDPSVFFCRCDWCGMIGKGINVKSTLD